MISVRAGCETYSLAPWWIGAWVMCRSIDHVLVIEDRPFFTISVKWLW